MRNYDNWINAYLAYSDHSEAPTKMHFWTGVSVIAGALRRRVWIDQKYFQWTPNMYIVFVAPPGIVSKSTTASIGMNLLKQVDGINFGPDVVTWQALLQQLGQSHEMFTTVDNPDVYFSQSALTLVSSEFGTFLNPNDREMVDALVSLWDGQVGRFEKSTKTQGSDVIENPWINVLACTTPDWIAGNFPEYMIGGGFTSRTVFVYADRKRKFVAYPSEQAIPDFHDVQKKLIQDLGHIANTMAGEYKLSPDAIAYGTEWYQSHYDNPPKHLLGERFGGYLARKQTHIHKLAMVVAAAQRDELIITRDDLDAAIRLVDELEKDMPKVFNRIGVAQEQRDGQGLIQMIWNEGEISNQALYQKAWSTMNYDQYNKVLNGALSVGWIKRLQRGAEIIWARGAVRPE